MEITLNIPGLELLATSINNLADAMKAGTKTEQVIETAKASAKKTTTKKPAAEPLDLAEQVDADTTADIPASPAAAVTRTDIQDLCRQISKAFNSPTVAVQVIQEFGAKFLKDVDDDQLPALHAALAAKLAEASNG